MRITNRRKKMSWTEIDVLRAKSEMLGYLDKDNMTLDPDLADNLAASIGLSSGTELVGHIVRITVKDNTDKYALYDINSLYEDGSDNNDGRMRAIARDKLNEDGSFDAYINVGQMAYTDKTVEWLSDNMEFGEFKAETNDEHDDAVICGPHGGYIESQTDKQVEWCYNKLIGYHDKDATRWHCWGRRTGVGAFDAWHVTSTRINPANFTLLKSIKDRAFGIGVAFHGFSEDDISIGGLASTSVKNSIKAAIEAVVGTAYDVNIVTTGPYAGVSEDNFINWLTNNNGIQIEQPLDARDTYGQGIAEAVSDVIATLI